MPPFLIAVRKEEDGRFAVILTHMDGSCEGHELFSHERQELVEKVKDAMETLITNLGGEIVELDLKAMRAPLN